MAQVMTSNRVAVAEPVLPQEVMRQGVKVDKQSTAMVEVVSLFSPNGTYDELFISQLHRHADQGPVVARQRCGIGAGIRRQGLLDAGLAGPGDAQGARAHDRRGHLRRCGPRTCSGGGPDRRAAQPGRTSISSTRVTTQGRLDSVEEFGDIIVKTGADGEILYLRRRGPRRARCARPTPGTRSATALPRRDRHLPDSGIERARGGQRRGRDHGRPGRRAFRRISSTTCSTTRPSTSRPRSPR